MMIMKIVGDNNTRNYAEELNLQNEASELLSREEFSSALLVLNKLHTIGGCNSSCLSTIGNILIDQKDYGGSINYCNEVSSHYFALSIAFLISHITLSPVVIEDLR